MQLIMCLVHNFDGEKCNDIDQLKEKYFWMSLFKSACFCSNKKVSILLTLKMGNLRQQLSRLKLTAENTATLNITEALAYTSHLQSG